MDLLTAENRLADYVATTVSLTLDQRVFAGNLPDALPEGIAVFLTECCARDSDNFSTAEAQIDFCFTDRTELETALHALLSALPEYECADFRAIELGDHLALSTKQRRGFPVYVVSVPVKLCFL